MKLYANWATMEVLNSFFSRVWRGFNGLGGLNLRGYLCDVHGIFVYKVHLV